MNKFIKVERRVTGIANQYLLYEVSAANWDEAIARYGVHEAVSLLCDSGKFNLLESEDQLDEVLEVHDQTVEVTTPAKKSEIPTLASPIAGNSDTAPPSKEQPMQPFKPRLDEPFKRNLNLFEPVDPVAGQRMEMQHVDDTEVWNHVEVKYVSESWIIVLTLDVAHTQELVFDPNEVTFARKCTAEEAYTLNLPAQRIHMNNMLMFYTAPELFDAGWRLHNVNFPEDK